MGTFNRLSIPIIETLRFFFFPASSYRIGPDRPRLNLLVRRMVNDDHAEVLEIEDECENSWTIKDIVSGPSQSARVRMVVEHENEVIAFFTYEAFLERIAVKRHYRRCGIGHLMIRHLIKKLSPEGRISVFVLLRKTDKDTQAFFKALRFEHIATLEKYYSDGEDAYQLSYLI
jgi:ribosomal protein S18 acetylase RimI-like enzyme